MPGWRRVIELTMTDEEIERLTVLSRSRTEAASRVSRAQMADRPFVRGIATADGRIVGHVLF